MREIPGRVITADVQSSGSESFLCESVYRLCPVQLSIEKGDPLSGDWR